MYELYGEKDKNAGSRGKVLIVDDSAISVDILKNIIESIDLKTEIATDGKEALIKYLTSKPYEYSIILMDNIMPSLTGIEATRIIRLCARDDSKIMPIISISSEMSEENIKEYKLAGYSGWMCKPINEKELVEVVNKYI